MKAFIAILTGGISDAGKIGIGVGIGVGGMLVFGMLVLGGILFSVLCRRYDWTKRTKTGRPYFTNSAVLAYFFSHFKLNI